MSNHYASVRTAKIKRIDILSIDEDVEQLEFCDIAGGNIKHKSGEKSVCVYLWACIITVLAVLFVTA